MPFPISKTKIVCTIGPASETPGIMEQMIRTGMDVARLNFSHGDFSSHARVIGNLRTAAKTAGRRIAIMADLPGPKMRIGRFAKEPIDLKPNDLFTLTTEDIEGNAGRVSVTFSRLPQVVKPGDTLFLNDGLIQMEVITVEGKEVRCRVRVGGELRSKKGLNLPGIDLGISAFTENDHHWLRFAMEQGVDVISQSFWVTEWRKNKAIGEVISWLRGQLVMGFQTGRRPNDFWKKRRNGSPHTGLKSIAKRPDSSSSDGLRKQTGRRGEGKPETFDFLGFTHICVGPGRATRFTIRRKTIAKRLRAKIKEVREEIIRRRHEPVPELGKWLRSVVQGHLNYFAVPGNRKAIDRFRTEVNRAWLFG